MCSRGDDAYSQGEGDDTDVDTDAAIKGIRPKHRKGGSSGMKKPIELDGEGQPFGSMKEALANDIKKYTKNLDPRVGWEKQPHQLRKELLKRLYKGITRSKTPSLL